jgi:hypothetical protein
VVSSERPVAADQAVAASAVVVRPDGRVAGLLVGSNVSGAEGRSAGQPAPAAGGSAEDAPPVAPSRMLPPGELPAGEMRDRYSPAQAQRRYLDDNRLEV